MTMAVLAWMLAIPLLGFATGLRTMTPIAVLCWFAYLGHLPVHQGWASWTTRIVTVVIFTALAVGEFIGDKLPKTPSRVSPFPLAARVIFGGLVGAIAARGLHGSVIEGIILAALCAVLGAFIGYNIRKEIVASTGWPDWIVAITEDAIAVLASVFAMGVIIG